MTPQKRRALIFLIAMLAISLAIVAWVFFVNFGKIEVSGETPFHISIGAIDATCAASPCIYKIKPGEELLIARKDGHFDFQQKVRIKRWRTIPQAVSFAFIPKIEKISFAGIPSQLKNITSNADTFAPDFDWGFVDFSKIPRTASEVIFSQSGKRALVHVGREYFLYEKAGTVTAADGASAEEAASRSTVTTLSEFEIPSFITTQWLGDDALFVLTAPASENESQQLIRYSFKNQKNTATPAIITQFERPFSQTTLIVTKNISLIAEQGGATYLIDNEKSSTKRLDALSDAYNFRHINDVIIGFEREAAVYLFDLTSEKETKIPALSSAAVVSFSENEVLYATKQSPQSNGTTGVSIEEFLEITNENVEELRAKERPESKTTLYFVKRDLESGEEREVATMPAQDTKLLSFSRNFSSGKIFLSMNGEFFALLSAK